MPESDKIAPSGDAIDADTLIALARILEIEEGDRSVILEELDAAFNARETPPALADFINAKRLLY